MGPVVFEKWIKFSRKGTRVQYHVGNLHFDREMSPAVDRKGQLAMRASEAGRLTLVQRRIREGICSYEAIRR